MNSRHLRKITHRMTLADTRREKKIRRNRKDRERAEAARAYVEAKLRHDPDKYLEGFGHDLVSALFYGNTPAFTPFKLGG